MNLNRKIGYLLDSGFPPNFISSLNESKINVLFEKVSKGEQSEAVQTTQQSGYMTTVTPGTKANLEFPGGAQVQSDPNKGLTIKSSKPPVGTGETTEGEMTEKFESKAQQGLFWARCNKCKTEDCKWCKMAKEFSKSTSKKEYETMSEKKHPENTVKYKKKVTKEEADYLDAVKSTYTKGLKNSLNTSLINPKFTTESEIREEFENIIQKNLRPTMNKRDLLRLIEATMGDTKEKETETETEKEEKKKTGNPFKRPKTKDDPEASETKEKETETETEKEEKKKTGNPFKKPKTKDDPEARRMKKESFTQQDFMKQVRNSGLI
jgi:hypothetical protein